MRPDWQAAALCAEVDPGAFYPERGQSTTAAKEVCRACSVIADCLEWALARGERYGVWGGTSERERAAMQEGSPRRRTPADNLCFRGLHPLAGPNLAVYRDGSRRCLACRRAADAERNARRRAAAAGAEAA